jgi:aconitate hydratase
MSLQIEPIEDIRDARILALLGNSVTTDHISPAGSIAADSPAAEYLRAQGVKPTDFNSYGSRRGNHEIMMRGTFANIHLRNQLAPGTKGGWTRHQPSNGQMSIYDASLKYKREGTPLVVIAGTEYGTGSSRDWAAKGTLLLGVQAVIAKSFERIHRSNLIGMGILPLQFLDGQDADSLGLTGKEIIDIYNCTSANQNTIKVTATPDSNNIIEFEVTVRIDTPKEHNYYQHGGILHYVLRQLATANKVA